MPRKSRYDQSPGRRAAILTVDEVEKLLGPGGHGIRGDDAVLHLLHRVQATLREHQTRLAGLQADVDRIRGGRVDARRPVVRAMEALDAMSEDEQRQLLDHRFMAEVDKLRRLREQLELEQAAARNEINRVRLILSELLVDEYLDPGIRQRIQLAGQRLLGAS